MTSNVFPDPSSEPLLPTTPGTDATGIEVIRSEERLRAGVERLVSGTVRIGKRVVTEERTVTVTVRREELVVEHVPVATTGAGPTADRSGTGPLVTLTLSEEVPEVVLRVVPRERVHVHVDRVTVAQAVTADVAREVVEIDGVDEQGITARTVDR